MSEDVYRYAVTDEEGNVVAYDLYPPSYYVQQERDREMMAKGWDERDRARASYLGPDHGHYEDCCGWEDCYCASYPNPYRKESEDA